MQLAKMFTAYLDNIAVLDDCSQQLSVFSFILFLFQICRMLKLKNNSITDCLIKSVVKHSTFFKRYFKELENQRASQTPQFPFSNFQQRHFQLPFWVV